MDSVTLSIDDNIAVITLNQEETRNALDAEMVVRLADAWTQVRESPEIRVAIITGTGKAFCSGANLGKLMPIITNSKPPANEWEEKIRSDRKLLTKALLRDFDTQTPVIAAINGYAVAGGMEMVMGTDIRVATDSAKFALQEVKWAVFPGGGSTVRLPKQIPYCKSMEMLLTGDMISADEALSYGLINHLVPQELLLDKAMEIARKIAANGPLAVKAIRASVKACSGLAESEALVLETKISAPVWKSIDAKEGPKAFMEKRKPVYKGH